MPLGYATFVPPGFSYAPSLRVKVVGCCTTTGVTNGCGETVVQPGLRVWYRNTPIKHHCRWHGCTAHSLGTMWVPPVRRTVLINGGLRVRHATVPEDGRDEDGKSFSLLRFTLPNIDPFHQDQL